MNIFNKLENPNPQTSATEDLEKEQEVLETEEQTKENEPILEDEDSVSFLGVRLEKAKNKDSIFVPDKSKYEDYIEDEFSTKLQEKIAISFALGDPILIEGGTGIGKTTTVKKMCAQLGWEVHYANLNGQTEVGNFMGKYIPKVEDGKEKGFVFSDGEVTKGSRQEEGKTKVIILDEFNSATPEVLIRMHEVTDALFSGSFVLSENGSEVIKVDKEKTKIVALMNPPGRGYLGREPLDPAQADRWTYIKEVTRLPEESRRDFLFGIAKEILEIPGSKEILLKYFEFHDAVFEMFKNRTIAEDQPQKIILGDRREMIRTIGFVKKFYKGDITETFQRALRYYYTNKLETDIDKNKLEELINHVAYIPESSSKRRGLEENPEKLEKEAFDFEKFEEKSLDYIDKLLEQGTDKDYIAQGLAGLDSDRAWKMRQQLIAEGTDKDYIALGLAGLDSDRAWKMREQFIAEGADKNYIAQGLAGDYTTFVWQLDKK